MYSGTNGWKSIEGRIDDSIVVGICGQERLCPRMFRATETVQKCKGYPKIRAKLQNISQGFVLKKNKIIILSEFVTSCRMKLKLEI